jgi:hypothetical protein
MCTVTCLHRTDGYELLCSHGLLLLGFVGARVPLVSSSFDPESVHRARARLFSGMLADGSACR